MTDQVIIQLQDHPSIRQRFICITPHIARQIVALSEDESDIPSQHQRIPVDEQEQCFDDYLSANRDFAWAIEQRDRANAERDKALADLSAVTAKRDRLAELLRSAMAALLSKDVGRQVGVACQAEAALAELEKTK